MSSLYQRAQTAGGRYLPVTVSESIDSGAAAISRRQTDRSELAVVGASASTYKNHAYNRTYYATAVAFFAWAIYITVMGVLYASYDSPKGYNIPLFYETLADSNELTIYVANKTVGNTFDTCTPFLIDPRGKKGVDNSSIRAWDMWNNVHHVGLTYSGSFHMGIALLCIAIIPIVQYGLDWALWNWMTKGALQMRTNYTRWLFDSLYIPLQFVCLAMFLAEFNVLTLVAYFGLVHVSVVLGYYMEVINSPMGPGELADEARKAAESRKSLTSRLGYFGSMAFSTWVNLLSIIPLVVYWATMSGVNETSATVWIAFGLCFFCNVASSYLQWAYQSFVSDPSSSMYVPFSAMAGELAENWDLYNTLSIIINAIFRITTVIMLTMSMYHDSKWLSEYANSVCIETGQGPWCSLPGNYYPEPVPTKY